MTWLTWRQFRIPAVAVYAPLLAAVVLLVITGAELPGRTDYSDMEVMFGTTILAQYLLPAVIGVFWGVPLVTRELETGTHNLVWNQSVTRKQWLTSKLGFGVLAAMIAAALLATAVTWWASPIDAAAAAEPASSELGRMSPVVFAARAIVPIGYAAFAFVLGVAVGIVLRKTVAAMAVTLVVFVAVMVAVPLLVRPYVLSATVETVEITPESIQQISGNEQEIIESIRVFQPAGAWVLSNETVDASGTAVFPLPDEVQECAPRMGPEPPRRVTITECLAQLSDLGYTQRVTYQPGHHFWPLQWIELGLFLALTALLTWFSYRRLRHV